VIKWPIIDDQYPIRKDSAISESPKFPYKVFGPWDRKINTAKAGEFVTNEALHPTVRALWNANENYRPKNLTDYLVSSDLIDSVSDALDDQGHFPGRAP
jgi:hypothetical protein